MTASERSRRTSPQTDFIQRLHKLDRGDRARLRRNAGNALSEARDGLGLFYRTLPPNVPESHHRQYFLLATLFPLAGPSDDRNLGATLRRIRDAQNAAALDRRVTALLDSDSGQLPFRLRQIIRLIESKRAGVNWGQLLMDLLQWDREDRRVQRAWAMAYFTEPTPVERANDKEDHAPAPEA